MSPNDIFCSSCGARNDSDAAYCRDCGSHLTPPPAVTEAAPPPPPASVPYVPGATTQQIKKSSPLPMLLALGAIAVLLVVVLIETVVILIPRGPGSDAGAILSVLQGRVSLLKGGERDWIEVTDDVVLEAGDRILTTDGSQALLTFMTGTTTEVRELTELAIEEMQLATSKRVVIRMRLDAGEIWNRIAELPADSLHEVTTLAATVTCRGSEYGIVVDEKGTAWVRGQDGRVEVTAGGSTVPVVPGDTLMVELGSPAVSYGTVAMVPTASVQETTVEVTSSIRGADMPTFLNQPLPTGTPTTTPPPTSTPRPTQAPPTPTATTTPQPTATRSVQCPTITIREPSRAPAQGPFGIEFDKQGPLPTGGGTERYWYAVEYRVPNGQWIRLPVPASVDKRGDYWMAEVRAPGEGEFWWRICLVNPADSTGPSLCCSSRREITHATDEPCHT
jgi:hypothetical protein